MSLKDLPPLPPGTAVPPGALIQYYSDLSSGLLAPEDMRIEDLQFRCRINPLGEVTFESESVMVVSRYNFAFRRVVGAAMNPELVGAAPMLVDFNIREEGRNFTIFKRSVSMQSVLGGSNIAEWDGVYICVPGTQISVQWEVDTQRWAGLVGATVEFCVQLLGDYVVCRGNF